MGFLRLADSVISMIRKTSELRRKEASSPFDTLRVLRSFLMGANVNPTSSFTVFRSISFASKNCSYDSGDRQAVTSFASWQSNPIWLNFVIEWVLFLGAFGLCFWGSAFGGLLLGALSLTRHIQRVLS